MKIDCRLGAKRSILIVSRETGSAIEWWRENSNRIPTASTGLCECVCMCVCVGKAGCLAIHTPRGDINRLFVRILVFWFIQCHICVVLLRLLFILLLLCIKYTYLCFLSRELGKVVYYLFHKSNHQKNCERKWEIGFQLMWNSCPFSVAGVCHLSKVYGVIWQDAIV